MAIRMERSEAVATIVIDRPEARNAVDGPAALALADAFREFEHDDELRVAVLWGAACRKPLSPVVDTTECIPRRKGNASWGVIL